MQKTGFKGTLPEFMTFLRTDPQFYAKTPRELLSTATYVLKKMVLKLKDTIGFLPRFRHGVLPVPDSLAPIYTGGRGGLERCMFSTLVIETTNFTSLTAFRGASDAETVIERLTPVDAKTIRYEFTVEDPKTWTAPWKGEVPMQRSEDKLYEYACHEGNYGIRNILSAQRQQETAAGRK